MPCPMCTTRGKTWQGSDPKCAFESERFNFDNWNCATMNALRNRAQQIGMCYYDDTAAASIGYIPFEGDEFSGYLVMTWYKDRGQTGNAIVMWDDEQIKELTLELAENILEWSKRYVPKESV